MKALARQEPFGDEFPRAGVDDGLAEHIGENDLHHGGVAKGGGHQGIGGIGVREQHREKPQKGGQDQAKFCIGQQEDQPEKDADGLDAGLCDPAPRGADPSKDKDEEQTCGQFDGVSEIAVSLFAEI